MIEVIIYATNGYSKVPIEMKPEKRFQNKCWINKIGEILNEREITIHNTLNSMTRITNNQMIIDYAWEYLKEVGNYKRSILLNRINRVSLKKQILLLFELVGIDRREMTNACVNNEEVSVIKQNCIVQATNEPNKIDYKI